MTPAQPGPILTLDAVRHAFGPRQALKGVSLAVRPGEIYALLGPNGAGKSTLVRVICGRIPPDSGTARIDGRDPFADGHARAMLGLAPQALALYPLLTVAENLEAFAHLAGLRGSAVRPAVTEAMAVTRVEARAGSQVRHLSGGFQRRVNIAAAILAKPRLLVLDEPTVGIDQAACEAVAEVLRQLRESGVGILLVTHDLAQAEGLADRVGFLRDGLKVLEGEPRALLADAFGGAMEVEVLIEADAAMCSRLSAEGLQPGREAGSWTCLDVDGFGRAAALAAQLAAVGLAPREIRVRRPALEHLVGRLAEPDLAA